MLPFGRQSVMIVAHMRSFGAAVRPALLSPLLVFMLMQPAPVHGSDTPGCLPLGKPVTLSGRLVRVDQRGYMEWIVLALPRPICALTDPADRFKGAVRGVTAVEAVSVNSEPVGSRLRRFLGKRVVLTGVLNTGAQAFELILDVASLQPTDAAGRALLATPDSSPAAVRDIPEYEVTVRAGRSLRAEAQERGTGKPLKPARDYAPHWMTGGEVVYVNCRDGYRRKLSSATNRQLIYVDDDAVGFGFNAYPDKPLVIKFRCIREDR